MDFDFIFGVQLAKEKTNRSAVLPYTVITDKEGIDEVHFLLAVDSRSGDITDFGGGVKQNECSLTAALREFKEESNSIFGSVYDQINDMTLDVAILKNNMSVIFLPISQKWYSTAPERFRDKYRTGRKSYNEVSTLLWVSEGNFSSLIESKKMWGRIRKFYSGVYSPEFLEILKTIYSIHF